jgi:REP element-mobilizing transposase RayT
MPRYARLRAPGALVHVISRVVNHEFRIVGETERTQYLYRLRKSLPRSDWRLLGFAVMSNHIHLALLAGHASSARLLQSVNTGYAGWLNKVQGRLGPVFAERYATILSDEAKAAKLIAYLHNNPVRAHVVGEAAESTWTSQRSYLEACPDEWLDTELGLSLCGFDSSPAGRQGFYDYVRESDGVTRDQIAEEGLTAMRRRVRAVAGAPVEITSPEVHDGGPAVQIIAPPFTPLRPRWPGDVQTAIIAVEVQSGVPIERMQSQDRHRRVVAARKLALHVWMHLGRDQTSMAAALGISRSAASQLLGKWDAETARQAEHIARCLWDVYPPTYAPET